MGWQVPFAYPDIFGILGEAKKNWKIFGTIIMYECVCVFKKLITLNPNNPKRMKRWTNKPFHNASIMESANTVIMATYNRITISNCGRKEPQHININLSIVVNTRRDLLINKHQPLDRDRRLPIGHGCCVLQIVHWVVILIQFYLFSLGFCRLSTFGANFVVVCGVMGYLVLIFQ